MLAQRQAIRILGQKAVERVEERYDGYRAHAVRTLKAIIDSQARYDSDTKRHQEVVAELDALGDLLTTRRGAL